MRIRVVLLAVAVAAVSLVGVSPADATDYTVSMSVDRTKIILGQKVTFGATVSPSNPGGKVQLQKRGSGTWKRVAVRKLDASSQARFRVEPPTRGKHTYRIVRPATPGSKRVIAGPLTVTVQEWRFLDTLSPSPSKGVGKTSVSFEGKNFGRSLVFRNCQPTAQVWTFDLGGKYDRFRGAVGVPDGGDPTRTKHLTVKADGLTFFAQVGMEVGESAPLSFSVAGRNQLTISVSGACGDPRAHGALGRPQVLR
jgi:hypothetical protein